MESRISIPFKSSYNYKIKLYQYKALTQKNKRDIAGFLFFLFFSILFFRGEVKLKDSPRGGKFYKMEQRDKMKCPRKTNRALTCMIGQMQGASIVINLASKKGLRVMNIYEFIWSA